MGKPPPPQGTMYVKRRTTVSRQRVLHSKTTSQRMEFLLSEGLGENVCVSMFC
jgi:hypothetical protein